MKLRDLRASKRITQKQLAECVGVTQGYICALEKGVRKNPSTEVIKGIAKTLGVKPSKVLDALEEAV